MTNKDRDIKAQQTMAGNLRLKAGPEQWIQSDTVLDLGAWQ